MTAGQTIAKAPAGMVLDRIIENIRARDVMLEGQARPAAILWTDPTQEWRALIELLQTQMEELVVLGDYEPEARTGPAIWVRCLVDRMLEEPALPEDRIPVIYMPDVGRQDLRAGESCKPAFRPLVELMYRGVLWLHPNGRDWTLNAFLISQGLNVGRDQATQDALKGAITEVATTQVAQLANKQLEADDFDRMLSGDTIRDLLRWMGDADGTQARLGENGWKAFCNRCREDIGFDPETEADVIAGERLGQGDGAWARVWDRFEEAPSSYAGIAELLHRSCPEGTLRFERERWPDLNDEDERKVRNTLKGLAELSHGDACTAVIHLEKEHGPRRQWVWARMGLSPMAVVLEALSRLALHTRTVIGGTTPTEIASTYMERGWQADAAMWETLAASRSSDETLVREVVRHLAEPWLRDSANAFQNAVQKEPLPLTGVQPVVEAADDSCLLFADGLRYDLGQRLAERLEGLGCKVKFGHRWAAAPTVTATAKPAVTPVAPSIVGENLDQSFAPSLSASRKEANARNLRDAMESEGYQVVGMGDLAFPMRENARGWTESGEIDKLGHKLEIRLANEIDKELNRLIDRIVNLLDAGWHSVRVVTDHGWLLLPGGLPKVDLPKHLTATRWARCAVISGQSTPDVMLSPWHWNSSESFATAPGITCFNKSDEYAHGGLSIQECLIPDLLVERAGGGAVAAGITGVTWRGLRCFVEAKVSGDGVTADLRLQRPNGASVVQSAKPVDPDGTVSLVLAGDEHEASSLVLVLEDADGTILTHKSTRVGESL